MTAVARLYEIFQPKHYDLLLELKEKELVFNGKCIIAGKLTLNKSKVVKLHAKNLEISKILVNDARASYKIIDDELIIELNDLTVQKIKIEIKYSGKITKAMHGIYPAYDTNNNVIIGTQFESHHAREAFPCIDEPEAKATFGLTLKTAQDQQVISNMPVKDQQNIAEHLITTFEPTPIMSTYLLAFVVGKLHSVSTSTSDGTQISVYSTPDHDLDSLIFPLEVAVKTIEFLNDYFGVKYPLPKLDQVALPDFSSGAMENWGLVTYREVALIADPNTISTSSKEYIATVIAHELAHQWFGNLVTMKWWDDLWLNESFATFMEYLVIDALYPEWKVMLSFASHEALSASRRDILAGVQSVATPVNHPDEISTLFDPSIVYAKGARLLLMAYNLVGDKNFRKGLKSYFEKHAYKNTIGDDLWQELSASSKIDVGSIMKTWINQSGMPYLSIEETDDQINIAQSQLINSSTKNDKLWPIPLWPEERLSVKVLETKSISIKAKQEPIRLNIVGGHYACLYKSKKTIKHISRQIKHGNIKPDERLLILNDSLILALCNKTGIKDSFELLQAYNKETEEAVWGVMSLVLSDGRMIVEGDEKSETILKDFTARLIAKQYDRLGWEDTVKDNSNDKKLRSIIASLAIYTDKNEYVTSALKHYDSTANIDKLPVDTRGAILSAVAKKGTLNQYQELLEYYKTCNNADVQMDITGALCATKDSAKFEYLLGLIDKEDYIRLQDMDRFLIYLLRNRFSRAKAWEWLVSHWDWITVTFASDKSYDNYPRYGGAAFSDKEWLEKYNDHFGPLKSVPALTRNIELGIKDIENKIAVRANNQGELAEWLKSQ